MNIKYNISIPWIVFLISLVSNSPIFISRNLIEFSLLTDTKARVDYKNHNCPNTWTDEILPFV